MSLIFLGGNSIKPLVKFPSAPQGVQRMHTPTGGRLIPAGKAGRKGGRCDRLEGSQNDKEGVAKISVGLFDGIFQFVKNFIYQN